MYNQSILQFVCQPGIPNIILLMHCNSTQRFAYYVLCSITFSSSSSQACLISFPKLSNITFHSSLVYSTLLYSLSFHQAPHFVFSPSILFPSLLLSWCLWAALDITVVLWYRLGCLPISKFVRPQDATDRAVRVMNYLQLIMYM